MRVSWMELLNAFEFVSAGGIGENQAFLSRQSDEFYYHSELADDVEELPDDIEDGEKYIEIPDKRELGLGKPSALNFARQFLPDDFDKIQVIFGRSGAYARFKDLLEHRGALQKWYDFEAKAEEAALREWCELHSIEVAD